MSPARSQPTVWKIGAVVVGAVVYILLVARAIPALLPHASGGLQLAVLAVPTLALLGGLGYVERRFFARERAEYQRALDVAFPLMVLVFATVQAFEGDSPHMTYVYLLIGLSAFGVWRAARRRPPG